MSDINERDAKLIQYLSEAYGKERELESALEAHIELTSKMPYKKRLRAHLTETKQHAKLLDRRIKKLGGAGGHDLQTAVKKTVALAKGPLHALRGTGDQETMLKNAKTEYFNEHEEIATYIAIETLAEKVGDTETAKLARSIRRDEERMAKFLERQITSLAKAVAMDEVPSEQRKPQAQSRKAPSRKVTSTATKRKAPAKRRKAVAA